MPLIIRKPEPIWTIKEFTENHNTILLTRKTGGFGDIMMHRMLFEDIKILCPEIKIHFAVPSNFMPVVIDHPYIDQVLDWTKVEPKNYLKHLDTTTICGETEMINAPFPSPHRSDIWANWCGYELKNHNMHINFTEEEIKYARDTLNHIKNRDKVVIFCPYSAIKSKNLDEEQIRGVVEGLEKEYFVCGLHTVDIPGLETTITTRTMREYMALIAVADYIITVDTAAFHVAGGIGKPQVGIFSWASGTVYGKYYKNWQLIQRDRDFTPGWDCGPCYRWSTCPKCPDHNQVRKPCITEITAEEILSAFDKIC